MYRHYITVDEGGRILRLWSDGVFPERDAAGAVLLRETERLFPYLTEGAEENPCIYEGPGVPLFRWDGGAVLPRTEEELQPDRDAEAQRVPEPSDLDRLEAQVTYTALMTDTLLE